MSHEFWLLRHGQSEGNAQSIRQGQSDYPLTDLGRRQVKALALYWQDSGIEFDKIIASPLSRALETARLLANSLGLEVETHSLWQERNSGQAEGSPLARPPNEAAPGSPRVAHKPVFADGESDLQLHIRASKGLQALLNDEPGRYLIVSHGGILNAVMHAILGLSPSGTARLPRFQFDNCSYALVRFQENRGQWQIERINANHHVEPGDQ